MYRDAVVRGGEGKCQARRNGNRRSVRDQFTVGFFAHRCRRRVDNTILYMYCAQKFLQGQWNLTKKKKKSSWSKTVAKFVCVFGINDTTSKWTSDTDKGGGGQTLLVSTPVTAMIELKFFFRIFTLFFGRKPTRMKTENRKCTLHRRLHREFKSVSFNIDGTGERDFKHLYYKS